MIPPMAMDRRSRTRMPDPPCPTCRTSPVDVRVTIRTASRLFYKCAHCGGVWDVQRVNQRSKRR